MKQEDSTPLQDEDQGTGIRTAAITFIFASADLDLYELQEIIIKLLRNSRVVDKKSILDFVAAIEECVVNAHEHGNLELQSQWKEEAGEHPWTNRFEEMRRARLCDVFFSARTISVEVSVTAQEFSCSVEDEGPGYMQNTHAATGPTAHYGRGLMLVDHFVDAIIVNDRGNRTTIIKRLEGAHKGIGSRR